MASICDDPNGRRRILFVAPDESRKALRLGKADRKSAEPICRHVEALLSAKIGGQPIPRETATWLSGIGEKLRERLVKVNLIEPGRRLTVSAFLDEWLRTREAMKYAVASLVAWGQSVTERKALFADTPSSRWRTLTASGTGRPCRVAGCGTRR